MGQLTRLQIITRGLAKASAPTALAAEAVYWLNAWLRSTYMAWPWPFLQKRLPAFSLAAGTQSFLLGAGSGGIATQVQRVIDPMRIYAVDYSARGNVRVQRIAGGSPESLTDDETVNNPATYKGQPEHFKARMDNGVWGKWTMIPTPVPERAYLLAIDYVELPDEIDVTSGGDSTKPIYPNDRTLIQAVVVDAMQHREDPRYDANLAVLASMVADDRVKAGSSPGINDRVGLDPTVFR